MARKNRTPEENARREKVSVKSTSDLSGKNASAKL